MPKKTAEEADKFIFKVVGCECNTDDVYEEELIQSDNVGDECIYMGKNSIDWYQLQDERRKIKAAAEAQAKAEAERLQREKAEREAAEAEEAAREAAETAAAEEERMKAYRLHILSTGNFSSIEEAVRACMGDGMDVMQAIDAGILIRVDGRLKGRNSDNYARAKRLEALDKKTVENGCTEGEALAAAEKAGELRSKHGLGAATIN